MDIKRHQAQSRECTLPHNPLLSEHPVEVALTTFHLPPDLLFLFSVEGVLFTLGPPEHLVPLSRYERIIFLYRSSGDFFVLFSFLIVPKILFYIFDSSNVSLQYFQAAVHSNFKVSRLHSDAVACCTKLLRPAISCPLCLSPNPGSCLTQDLCLLDLPVSVVFNILHAPTPIYK